MLFIFWPFGKKKSENIVGHAHEEHHAIEDKATPPKREKECSVCGKLGADKKWAGQYFHKSCMRKMRKMAKSMV